MTSHARFGWPPQQCPRRAVGWQRDRSPTRPTSAWALAGGASGSQQGGLPPHMPQCPAALAPGCWAGWGWRWGAYGCSRPASLAVSACPCPHALFLGSTAFLFLCSLKGPISCSKMERYQLLVYYFEKFTIEIMKCYVCPHS